MGFVQRAEDNSPYQLLIQTEQHDEESTCRKASSGSIKGGGGWKAAMFVIGVEIAERIAYYGIATNLITYLTDVVHESPAAAAKNVNNWSAVTYVAPFWGALVADAYLGRYWTIVISSIIYILGLVLLTLSVSLSSLKPPQCNRRDKCIKATSAQIGILFFSLYLISVGTGGHKTCLEAFGADQFDDDDPEERKRKSSFFNWWYFGVCTGVLLSVIMLPYIQENIGWGVGFGIPAVTMAIAVSVFLYGSRIYRHKMLGASPINHIIQVLVGTICSWNAHTSMSSTETSNECPSIDKRQQQINQCRRTISGNQLSTVEVTHNMMPMAEADYAWRLEKEPGFQSPSGVQIRTFPSLFGLFWFIDQAAIHADVDSGNGQNKPNNWRHCTLNQVDDIKLLVRVVPVWVASFMYGIVVAQTSTFFTKQGSTMERRLSSSFEIPAASFHCFIDIAILAVLPVYDCIIIPIARKLTGKEHGITLSQRIGAGMFFSILSMVSAAMSEMLRLKAAKDYDLVNNPDATIPISIFWLLPQYILHGISDALIVVGLQEYFYNNMPDTMRTLGIALSLSVFGVGNFLSSILISLVESFSSRDKQQSWFVDNLNKSHLDYFYWLLVVLSALNFSVYVSFACSYTYDKVENASSSYEEEASHL
eukprot:Gb_11866 [translate_table: standard]